MSAALPGIISGLIAAAGPGVTVFGTTFVGFSAFAVTAGGSLAMSFISQALAPKPPKSNLGSFSQQASAGRNSQFRQPITPWDIIYGEILKSGPVTYIEVTNNKKFLHMILTIASHPCKEFSSFYLNDLAIYPDQLDGDGFVQSGKFANRVRIQTNLGTIGSQPFPDLVSESGTWDDTYRQEGHTKVYIRLAYDLNTFAGGVPRMKFRVKGKEIYDPRTTTTYWNPNAVLNTNDYLRTDLVRGGLEMTASEIDQTQLIASANICDEFVAVLTGVTHTSLGANVAGDYLDLEGSKFDVCKFQTGDQVQLTSTGTLPIGLGTSIDYYIVLLHERQSDVEDLRIQFATTYANALSDTVVDLTSVGTGTITIEKTAEPRYTVNGVVVTDSTPNEILNDMRTSFAGRVLPIGGLWYIVAGVWETPTVTITQDDLVGPIQFQTKHSRRELFNAVKGVYINPVNSGQPSDYPTITNVTYENEDGGETIFRELDLAYTSRAQTAQRIGTIELQRHRRQTTATITTNLMGLQLQAANTVAFTYDRLNWVDKTFEIAQWKLIVDGTPPAIICEMVIREADSSIYVFDPNAEETIVEPPADTNLGDDLVEPPTAIVITENPYSLEGSVTVSWVASDALNIASYQVEYIGVVDSEWTITDGTTEDTNKIVSPIVAGDYFFRVKAWSVLGLDSEYLTSALTTVNTPAIIPRVSGLELRGGLANGDEFAGKDAKFVWRDASETLSYDLGEEPYGGDSGSLDVYFKDYEIRILDQSEEILRVEHTVDPFFDYTYEKNGEDNLDGSGNPIPQRSFTLEVYQRGAQNQISALPARITVSNPAPGQLASLSIRASFKYIFVEYVPDDDLDFAGVQVFRSIIQGFTPGPSNLVATSSSQIISIDALPATTYYLKVAAFDAFGTDGVVFSPEIEINTTQVGTTDIQEDSITTPLLLAGAVTTEKMTVAELSAITANVGTLNAGTLQNSSQTTVISLDDGSILIAGPAGQLADDYLLLTDGILEFYHWTGSTHVLSKAVTGRQSGQASDGDTITIPGFFESEPTVITSPNDILVFDVALVAQSQALNLDADNLREDPIASGTWKFDASAKLVLGDNSGSTVINLTSGATSDNTFTLPSVGLVTAPPNLVGITVYVNLRSVRGTGTAPTYNKRQVRWRIGYRATGTGDALTYTTYQTKAMSIISLNAVADQRTIAVTSGEYDVYVEYIAEDAGGTFDFGSGGFDFDQDTRDSVDTAHAESTTSGVNDSDSFTLATYTPPAGWTVYSVDWTYDYGYGIFASQNPPFDTGRVTGEDSLNITYGSPAGDSWDPSGQTETDNTLVLDTTKSWTTATYNTTNRTLNVSARAGGGGTAKAGIKAGNYEATIYIRKPTTNSTTADNTYEWTKYDWSLTGASVIATGTMNWIAFGNS